MNDFFAHWQNSKLNRPFGIGLAVLGLVILSTFLVIELPEKWSILIILFLAALGAWAFVLAIKRDFEALFLSVLVIGFFQGVIIKLAGDAIPPSLWGLVKYGLLLLMIIGYGLRVMAGVPVLINRAMQYWMAVWLLVCFMLGILILEAQNANPLYSPIGTIQDFGIGNMILAIMVYLRFRATQLDTTLWIFTWAGFIAAIFGVIQRLLGTDRLAALGLLKGGFNFLGANNPETGFLDIAKGFRAFSFFDSHHAFSAFLLLSIVALQILSYRQAISRMWYWLIMGVLWAGFAVTFNLTNTFIGVLILVLFGLLERSDGSRSFQRALLNKRFLKASIFVLVVALTVIALTGSLRNRFLSIFNSDLAGAGGSLSGRLVVFSSGIKAVFDYPLGLGLYLNPGGVVVSDLVGHYARANDYFISRGLFFTGDNWFQWLMVQIGLPGFALYACLFLIPIFWALSRRNRLRDRGLRTLMNGLLALMICTFIGGISNSPILVFPPSNVLIWAAAGLLMKAPSWDDLPPSQSVLRSE